MKKLLFIFLILILSFSCSAAYADDLADVQSSGVLRLGVMQEYIPFVFTADDGSMTGMDVALVQEIGRRMNVRVQVVSMAFDGLIDALELGQIDMIGGAFAKTSEREEKIDFSRVYYAAESEFIGKTSLNRPQTVSMDSFRDLKIGVQKGTSFDQWVKTNLVNAGYVSTRNVYTYSSAADEMRALDRGDVDLVVLSQDVYEDLYQSSGKYQIYYDDFMKESYAFGLRKGSTLTSVVNEHLSSMMKDGTAQTIANRFFQMNFNEAKAEISRSSAVSTPTPNIPIIVVPTQSSSACLNGMVFVSDVTITDGHQVSRGESFRKIWRVKNTGSCPWTTNYTFVYVSGDQMSGRNISVPSAVQPGQTVDLGVDFVAPNQDGTYRGYWQMRSPQGQNFGETIWVKVRVNGGGSGGSRVIPAINSFYPDFYSGGSGTCPTVYWNTSNTAMVDISVDGVSVVKSYSQNGAQKICGPLMGVGYHTVQLAALSATDTTYQSFTFHTEDEGQRRVVPVINYFYVNPDSGYQGDSATAYWSVSNAASIDFYVDGAQVTRTYDFTGSGPITSLIRGEGVHNIKLVAHSVTDDTQSTVYYTVISDGQHQVIPNFIYSYLDSESGTLGSSSTVYWGAENAAVVDVAVDGNMIVTNGPTSGSASITSMIQSVGIHTITLRARSVTDDVIQTLYYVMADYGGSDTGWLYSEDDVSDYSWLLDLIGNG